MSAKTSLTNESVVIFDEHHYSEGYSVCRAAIVKAEKGPFVLVSEEIWIRTESLHHIHTFIKRNVIICDFITGCYCTFIYNTMLKIE